MKKCIKCEVLKDEKEFIDDKGEVVKTCKRCREYLKVYYARNRERLKEHYKRNKEHKKEYSKEYYERNKERVKEHRKEYNKEYREQMKDQIKEYMKEYNSRPAKYETYAHRLTVEESPKKGKKGELLVRCTKCGSYFAPTNNEVQHRVKSLEGKMSGESRLYCSQDCKDSCEIYWVKNDPYAEHAQFERDPQWAKMVKERANFICERCGSTSDLEAHHEIPVKVNPELVNDEDNGICLCHDCHMKAHADDGCTLSDLRNL